MGRPPKHYRGPRPKSGISTGALPRVSDSSERGVIALQVAASYTSTGGARAGCPVRLQIRPARGNHYPRVRRSPPPAPTSAREDGQNAACSRRTAPTSSRLRLASLATAPQPKSGRPHLDLVRKGRPRLRLARRSASCCGGGRKAKSTRITITLPRSVVMSVVALSAIRNRSPRKG